jgi:hypothetical protein
LEALVPDRGADAVYFPEFVFWRHEHHSRFSPPLSGGVYLFYNFIIFGFEQADSVLAPIMGDEEASTSSPADSQTQPQKSAAVSAAN